MKTFITWILSFFVKTPAKPVKKKMSPAEFRAWIKGMNIDKEKDRGFYAHRINKELMKRD